MAGAVKDDPLDAAGGDEPRERLPTEGQARFPQPGPRRVEMFRLLGEHHVEVRVRGSILHLHFRLRPLVRPEACHGVLAQLVAGRPRPCCRAVLPLQLLRAVERGPGMS